MAKKRGPNFGRKWQKQEPAFAVTTIVNDVPRTAIVNAHMKVEAPDKIRPLNRKAKAIMMKKLGAESKKKGTKQTSTAKDLHGLVKKDEIRRLQKRQGRQRRSAGTRARRAA